ncbi:MAG: hypothetical protein JKY61_11020 [Planctomycetes bacterium]|nr:hypothetical protein [Planctomycetota bacterium]
MSTETGQLDSFFGRLKFRIKQNARPPKKRFKFSGLGTLTIALTLLPALACNSNQGPITPPKDAVLAPGQSIRITNANGSVLVAWDDVASRHFTYKDTQWTEPMIVREYIWYGAWGIYSAGDNYFDRTREVGRLMYGESCVDFDSEEELKKYMDGEWNKNQVQYVWNEDGLVGGLHFQQDRRGQLVVDLWEITVQGQVPELFTDSECAGGTIEFVARGE